MRIAKKVIIYLGNSGLFNWLPDRLFLQIMYRVRTGESLNLKNPVKFNEKLQWIKLYCHKDEYSRMVDKFEVRDFIKEKLGEGLLIPLIGVYDNFDQIDFEELPNKFVLKCTHDSGGIVICRNKKSFSIEDAKKKINKSMRKNYFYHAREYPYKSVVPRIIIEEYLVDESNFELKDYKIWCFNGEPKFIAVHSGRGLKEKMEQDFFDLEWRKMNARFSKNVPLTTEVSKPETLKEMIDYSKKLSCGMPFVRIDFYDINGELFFGEITFFPNSGWANFSPNEHNYHMGEWIELPELGF